MLTRDYFFYAYKLRMFYKRHWLLAAFSINAPHETYPDHYPVGMIANVKGEYQVKTEGGVETITDADATQPLFTPSTPLTVEPGESPLITTRTETYYSTFVTNVIAFEYAFGDIIPYQNRKLSGAYIDKLTASALKEGTITVTQYRNFTRAMSLLTALLPAVAPGASKKMYVPPKDMYKLRDRLLKENKDRLDDPTVIADIENQLIDHYKEYIKGDSSEGFLISGKDINVSLKRNLMLFGGEPQLEDQSKYDLAIPSLNEGWQVKDLPMMVNSLRMGSYLRGASTALGGEAAKFSARVFQNTALQEADCLTKVGIPVRITEFNRRSFKGRYHFVNGKELQLGEDAGAYLDKIIYLRSPLTCHASGDTFCAKCMGDTVTKSGIGLGSQASKVGSRFLDNSLAAMHGSKLAYAKYDKESCLG